MPNKYALSMIWKSVGSRSQHVQQFTHEKKETDLK